MGVQSKAWFGKSCDPQGFMNVGDIVAHNRDVRYSPTHSELLSDVDCTYQATASAAGKVLLVIDSTWAVQHL